MLCKEGIVISDWIAVGVRKAYSYSHNTENLIYILHKYNKTVYTHSLILTGHKASKEYGAN